MPGFVPAYTNNRRVTKMKRAIGFIMIVIALTALVSCNNEIKQNVNSDGTVDLKMAILVEEETKALNYSSHYAAGFDISSYEYRATCTSTAGARGTQASWTTLSVSEGSATLSKMDRGSWTIEVRAKNSNGGVISQGSIDVVLTSNGQDAAINLKNVDGATSATVSIGVTVPILASGSVEVKYTTLSDIANLGSGTAVTMTGHPGYSTALSGTGVVATTSASGQNGYTGSVSLAPGLYVMQVLYKDGATAVAGQTMAFRVADNTPFAINGTLTAGEFLDLDLTPITVDDRIISVAVSSDATVTSGTLACTVTASTTAGSLTSPTYNWYLDGALISDQNTATFSKTGYGSITGTHVLTCIVSGTVNGENVAGYASSSFTINP